MKAKIVFCICLFITNILIGGCWDKTDIDQISIVSGMGIDRSPDSKQIIISFQIINPGAQKTAMGGGGTTEKPFLVESAQGKNLSEAIRNLSKISPRKLFFAHSKIIIFGKDYAQSDILEVMDYIERDRQIRRTNWILVAKEKAKDVLQAKMDVEKISARGIDNMLTVTGENVFIYPINRNEFLLRLKSDAKTSYAPIIELIESSKESNQNEGGNKGDSQQASAKKISLGNETAIFKNDKMIGTISDKESKGLLWLINKVKNDTIVIQNKNKSKEIGIEIFQANTTITPKITNQGITMQITCKGEGRLREAEKEKININDIKKFKQIEKKVEEILKAQVEKTINIAQKKLRADFVGFATQIHNNYPYEWKEIKPNWEQIFPDVKYNLVFDITISRSGMINDSEEESRRKEK